MDVSLNPVQSREIADSIAKVLENGSVAVLATLVKAPQNIGAKLLVEASGSVTASLGNAELDRLIVDYASRFLASKEETRTVSLRELGLVQPEEWLDALVMFECIEPEPHIVVCGAGHVGASLARLSNLLGYRTTLIDDRADFVARDRFPEGIDLIAADSWTAAIEAAVGNGRGVYVAIVTRGHNEDEECLRAVISLRPNYVGLIGSKRRTNIVLERLKESGFADELLKEVRGPIGLDIGAVSPEEVGLAILAEIVAERRGGTGTPLSQWRRQAG